MRPSTKKTAVLLGAAVALSSGAYALGSQAGDGGAVASSPPAASAASATVTVAGQQRGRDRGPRGGRGLDTLAGRLGVRPEALRAALQDLRGPKAEGRGRQDVAAALAAALSLPVDKVTAALDAARPEPGARGGPLAAALAKELDLDAAKVRAALAKVRPRPGDRRGALVNALASELGVGAAKVRAALAEVRPARGGGRGDRLGALAQALGVSEDRLRAGLAKAQDDQRAAVAKALAQRLSIDAAKVQEALEDLPRGGRRHG